MKIVKVLARTLQLPVQYLLLEKRMYDDVVLLEVETDEGLKGYAMSGCLLGRQVRDFINQEAGQSICEMDPVLTEQVRARLLQAHGNKRPFGVFIETASLIDVAMWDLKGKRVGLPVWKLLGGAHNPVPAYITYGLPQYTTAQLVEAAKILVKQGHTRLKMVVARKGAPAPDDAIQNLRMDWSIQGDAERVAAVREAVGKNVQLMMDANWGFNLEQAAKLAHLVEPYNLTWFEDPVYGADPRMLAELRTRTSIPIAAGSTGTEQIQRARELLVQRAVDILQPNVRDIGGYTEAAKAAAMAQAFNIPVAMGGNWPHMNMQLQAGVANGSYVEFHYGGWKMAATVFKDAADPANGWVTIPDRPGVGLEPKEDVVKEYTVA